MTNAFNDNGKLDLYCNAIRAMRFGVFDKIAIGDHNYGTDKLGVEISQGERMSA